MKFDKETIIAMVCCLLLIIAWPQITSWLGFAPVEENRDAENIENSSAVVQSQDTAAAAAQTTAAVTEKKADVEIKRAAASAATLQADKNVVIENGDLRLTVSPVNGDIVKTEFIRYDNSARDKRIVVTPPENTPGIFAITGQGWMITSRSAKKLTEKSCLVTRIVTTPRGVVEIRETLSLADSGYIISCNYEIVNPGKVPVLLDSYEVGGAMIEPWHIVSGDKKRTVSHRWDYFTTSGDHDDISAGKDFINPAPQVAWAAVSNKYFCGVLKRLDGTFTMKQNRVDVGGDEEHAVISAGAQFNTPVEIAPGGKVAASFQLYYGPKNIDALDSFAEKGVNVMHLAWGPLNYLARALFWILSLFYKICGSYGLSIILLTLLVRAVFYPLTARGNESMKKMQKVQPKFKELREKYKDNPQLLNQKMSELYRQEGVNPFAGCLPILLQIPIFFALYAMLDNVIQLRHVSFLWCKNLAAADTVASIPLFGWSLPINPLVLAMTVLMVIQQRMTPMSMEPAQKKMMAMMPVIMLLFLYDLPSGLTLYWTVSNLFSIIQLWLQKKRGQKPDAAAPAK